MGFARAPKSTVLCFCLVFLSGASSHSTDVHVKPVIDYFNEQVRPWISSPLIRDALKARNAATAKLTAAEIAALDAEWLSEMESDKRPLIDKALGNVVSQFLRAREDDAGGIISEIILMDARGLNAGQSDVTSDYWQGDEDKFIKSFGAGPGAIFVDEARKDESSQVFQAQVSVTVVDEKGRPIGAITVGVNLDQL